ncbi:MAG: amidohydrolase [Pannonibacter sp.]
MCYACDPGFMSMMRNLMSRRAVIGAIGHGGLALAASSGRAFAATAAPSQPARGDAVSGADSGADHIFLARLVLTMNPAQPRAEAIAVRQGRIIAVGSKVEILGLKRAGTQITDFGDLVVTPGFIDPHMHSSFSGLRPWLDVGPFTTATLDEARAKITARAAKTPKGMWVQAKMLDPSIMPGQTFDLAALDAMAPDNPLFILESNGHVAYVNSAALALAGIGTTTPNPPQGRYVRDTSGVLTGRLEESPAYDAFFAHMPPPSDAETLDYLRSDIADAAATGVTTLHDCGLGQLFGAKDVELIDRLMLTNPPVRYAGFLVSSHYDTWAAQGMKPGPRSPRFFLTGIKAWADGSNQAQTGFMREPYLGSTSRGALNYTPEQIEAVIARAHGDGWPVGVHANGDAAIDATIAAFDRATGGEGGHRLRHRLEHASILHDDQIAEMARLGLSPSFLIGHVYYWGRAFRDRILGPERASRLDPCASALKAGLRISLHSDYNVTPIEPLRFMQNAVTRSLREGGDVLNPAECITAEQALCAVTRDAAWQCHLDHLCGSLEPGKMADLAVLEDDPTAVAPDAIQSIRVHGTWLEGEATTNAMSH